MKILDIINTDSPNNNEDVITIINYLLKYPEIKELDFDGIKLNNYFEYELKDILNRLGYDKINKY